MENKIYLFFRIKNQMYSNVLPSSDERSSLSAFDRNKSSTYGTYAPNPSLNAIKKLYIFIYTVTFI